MKKEVVIAIFFGIVLGLSVALVTVSKIRQEGGKNIKMPATTSVSKKVTRSASSTQTFEIQEPNDKIITSKNTILIKGKTEKSSLIVVQSPTRDLALQNKNDDFSFSFPLSLGENVISITSYPKNTSSRSQSKTLTVYYFNEQ